MSRIEKFRGFARLISMLTAVLVIALTSYVGCANSRGDQVDSNRNQTSKVDFGKSTVARCLRNNRTTFAASADQLAFLLEAEAHDMVTPYAFAYDQAAKLSIEMWSKAPYKDKREWLMWIGQPFEQEMSPLEIVNSPPSRSYVAYVIRPAPGQRRALEGCTHKSAGKSEENGSK